MCENYTILEKIIYWFTHLFFNKKNKENNSNEIKIEMCKRALQSNICSHNCDACVWNTLNFV